MVNNIDVFAEPYIVERVRCGYMTFDLLGHYVFLPFEFFTKRHKQYGLRLDHLNFQKKNQYF